MQVVQGSYIWTGRDGEIALETGILTILATTLALVPHFWGGHI